MINPENNILVLGGHGFIGRYLVKNLQQNGTTPLIGTRATGKALKPNDKRIVFHEIHTKRQWRNLLVGVRVVINCVGILRERKGESFEQVHHEAVASLAQACSERGIRLIHVSALGLENPVTSGFALSKKRGEDAIRLTGGNWHIVRASIVDAADGYGASWFRRIANWPIHFAPMNLNEKISPITADDLGCCLAKLALGETSLASASERIYEVGCGKEYTVFEYLTSLSGKTPLLRVRLPDWFVRSTAFVCDCLKITPLTFGHYELLKYRNAPQLNMVERLLGKPPAEIKPETTSTLEEDEPVAWATF